MDAHPDRVVDQLLRKMWYTKGCRFNAFERLRFKKTLSSVAVVMLGFYIFTVSLLQLVAQKCGPGSDPRLVYITLVLLAVLLITVTLLEGAKHYALDADRHYRCAREVSELFNTFEALSSEEADGRRVEFNRRYGEILGNYEVDHADIDYRRFRIDNRGALSLRTGEFLALAGRYTILATGEYFLYALLIGVPPVVILWLLVQNRLCI
jgi:SMODS and SLOG-associating 2TM effector domain family 5